MISWQSTGTKSFSPERVVVNRSKTGLGGSSAYGRVPSGHVVQSRLAFGTSPAARTTVGAADLFRNKFVVLPHCATRRWTVQENQSHGCLQPPGLEVVPPDGKGRVHLADGGQGSSRFSFPTTSSRQTLNLQNVTLYLARHAGASIDRAVNERPLSECKSRGQ